MPQTVHEFPSPPRKRSAELPNGVHQGSEIAALPSSQSVDTDMDIIAEGSTRSRRSSISDEDDDLGPTLHVEVRLRRGSNMQPARIRQLVSSHLQEEQTLFPESLLEIWEEVDVLRQHVDRIWIRERSDELPESISTTDVELRIHVYRLTSGPKVTDINPLTEDRDEDEQASGPAASVKELPAPDLDGLWDNLIYSDDLKGRLLRYIFSTMLFADAGTDPNIISWNRMVLLHGPPGTGKTSLCRALAQKLSIRLSDSYFRSKLVEINSHSLFSKWFSESGKLVQKLFASVEDMASEQDCFVVVMIDEVESLTAARAGAMSGNEPSDAVRVVNALLTGLDRLKPYKNVLVMTTSNIAGAIDPAFVDRADIKEFVDYPPPEAVYMILSACLTEAMDRGLVNRQSIAPWKLVMGSKMNGDMHAEASPSEKLKGMANKCYELNLAGRFLRRLPVLSHARYLATASSHHRPIALSRWLDAMERVMNDEQRSRGILADADGRRGGNTGTTKVKVEGRD